MDRIIKDKNTINYKCKGKNGTKRFCSLYINPTYACIVELERFCDLVLSDKKQKFLTFWYWFWWSRLSSATGGLKVRVLYTTRRRLNYKSETTYYIQQDTASWKFEQCNLWFFILGHAVANVILQCERQPIPNNFTVHGLWPQNYTANRSKGIDCKDPSLRGSDNIHSSILVRYMLICQIQKNMHVIVHIYIYIYIHTHSQNCRREL